MLFFDQNSLKSILDKAAAETFQIATESAILEFESKCNFQLPEAHRELLLKCNGGEIGPIRLFGVGRTDYLDLGNQVSEMREEIQGMANGPIYPIACDFSGSYFCYDLTGKSSPKGYPVLFWDHEFSEEPSERKRLWKKVSPDFVGFMLKAMKL